MKTLAKILLSVLLLLVLGAVGGYFYMKQKFAPPANELRVEGLPAVGPLRWEADTAARGAGLHAALLVPVTLPGCPHTCYLQLDTGAPYTLLYGPALATLGRRYPAVLPALQPRHDSVYNVGFGLGGARVTLRRAVVKNHGRGQWPADSTQPFLIGTLGTDALEGRALVLDLARGRFVLAAAVPDSLARRADFVPLAFESRRVLLEAGLQGETKQLMYDTGTSAYALLTSQGNWHNLREPGAAVQTQATNSWGTPLTSYTAPTPAALQLGAVRLPLGTVTHIEGMNLFQRLLMSTSGLGGMLGNEPFATRTIILDVAGGRFGVVR